VLFRRLSCCLSQMKISHTNQFGILKSCFLLIGWVRKFINRINLFCYTHRQTNTNFHMKILILAPNFTDARICHKAYFVLYISSGYSCSAIFGKFLFRKIGKFFPHSHCTPIHCVGHFVEIRWILWWLKEFDSNYFCSNLCFSSELSFIFTYFPSFLAGQRISIVYRTARKARGTTLVFSICFHTYAF